jgi:predicted ArsR family transcriptional regulator
MTVNENEDEGLRERALEYLRWQRSTNKKSYEFTAAELASELGICTESVYGHMDKLVQKGDWEAGMAYDPVRHREVRVWRLVEKKEDVQAG